MTEPLLLLAVDMDLSPATQAMLQMVRSWLAELAPQSQALLLTVIPVPYDTPSSLGRFRGQAPSLSATTVQRAEARHTVQLARAPCPVMLVPRPPGPTDLVAWYEAAITRELCELASGLSIFTPEEVVSRFAPWRRTRQRRKEVTAAKKALQQLAGKGILICQQVKGTWQCFND